jgi:hypothetical protein
MLSTYILNILKSSTMLNYNTLSGLNVRLSILNIKKRIVTYK